MSNKPVGSSFDTDRPHLRKALLYWVVLFGMAGLGCGLVFTATRLGAGLTDDSYFYIAPARLFAMGGGMSTSPLFPPFLPYLLGLINLSGLDALIAVRFLNAGFFGLTIILGSEAVRRLSGSMGMGCVAGLFLLASENLINVYSWAMSEPVYIGLLFMDLLMLAEYLRTGQKAAWWGACLLASAAALTRYVGVCMVGAGSLLLLFQPGRETGRRWRDAIVYGVVGILPVAGYVGSNWVTQNSPFGERGFAVAGYDPNFTRAALGVFLNWIIPGRLVNDHEYLALGALLAGILIFAGWVSWNKREAIQTVLRAWWSSPITKFLLGFLLLNGFILFILLFTSGIIGRGESFSNRYLSPLYASLLVLTLGLAGILWKALDGKARLVLSLAGLVLAASFIYRSLETVRDLNQNGAGYASQRWHISETVAFLNKHPDVPVVSTANYGIYFWTGRLPQSISDFPDVAALHNYLRVSHAYLAIIDSMPPEMYKLDTSSLLSGLELVYRFSEGSIYQAVP